MRKKINENKSLKGAVSFLSMLFMKNQILSKSQFTQ